MLKKLVFLALVLLAAFFAYNYFFSGGFDAAMSDLRSLEGSVGVSQDFLLPATKENLADYKNGLRLLKQKWFNSQGFLRLADIKLSLVDAGEGLFFVADEFPKINKQSPNCETTGEVAALKKKAGDVKKSFNIALAKKEAFVKGFPSESQKAQEISGETFSQTISGATKGVDKISQILETYCTT